MVKSERRREIMKYLEAKGTSQAELITDSKNWGNYFDSEYSIINTNIKNKDK